MLQVFDENELLERIDHDMDFLNYTVQLLSTDGKSLMNEIRDSVERGDAPALSRSAHTLKGMISNFCSLRTQSSAFEVEKAAKSGDLAAAPAAVKELQARLDELITALNEFLAARK